MSSSKILFLMSGSIAAFKACDVISKLVKAGHEVQVAVTPSTLHFVGKATLDGLTGRPALSDLWQEGAAMEHIHLARWADLAILCPASAQTIAKLAHGFSDDLVSALTLAWEPQKPFHIFPAMNEKMYEALATQENLEHLERRGFQAAPTGAGTLACGEFGAGRLLEPDEILSRLFGHEKRGKLLITSGATREPIDGVRYISNVSTGATGAELCERFESLGWNVTFVVGEGAILPRRSSKTLKFQGFQDLDETLRTELGTHDYDGVIQCAAVSDFSVGAADTNLKLSSDREVTLHLKRNHKIISRLKEYSRNKSALVVGFKLTLNATDRERAQAAQKVLDGGADAVATNDWAEVKAARGEGHHPGVLISPSREPAPFKTVHALSQLLNDLFLKNAKGKT